MLSMLMSSAWRLPIVVALLAGAPPAARAQAPEPATRVETIEQAQAEKAKTLTDQAPRRAEAFAGKIDQALTRGGSHGYPFFKGAYSGAGFPFGAGYSWFVSAYNTLDLRGSYSSNAYKLAEAQFLAPRIFDRHGTLKVLGGWRDATQVPFYGIGPSTQLAGRVSYGFEEPYGSALLNFWPTRRLLMLRAGVEVAQWKLKSGSGRFPSVDSIYDDANLPGIGATVNYLHTQAGAAFDSRISPLYARRGGYYGLVLHEYADRGDRFGFHEMNYEAIQHVPILREAWVLSFHALATTASTNEGERIPFFMTPSLGNGSTLRAYNTRRFRGDNTLLLQAEWRIMVNRFMDSAFFYDAGKATARRRNLNFADLAKDFGFGLRFHGPMTTLLRLDVAKGREGYRFIASVDPVF